MKFSLKEGMKKIIFFALFIIVMYTCQFSLCSDHFSLDRRVLMKRICKLVKPKYILETNIIGDRASIFMDSSPLKLIFINHNLTLEQKSWGQQSVNKFTNCLLIKNELRKLLTKKFLEESFPQGISWVALNGGYIDKIQYSDLLLVYKHLKSEGIIILEDCKCDFLGDFCRKYDELYKIELVKISFTLLTKSKVLFDRLHLLIYGLRNDPWLTEDACSFLVGFLHKKPQAKILEFGSGASTVWFSRRTPNLVSIEHNKFWFDKVINYISRTRECNEVDFRLMEKPFEPIVKEFPNEFFDLILVDGGNRIECIKAAIRVLKKGGVLVLDDAQWYYPKVNNLLSNWKLTETIQTKPDRYGDYPYHGKKTNWWIKP